MVGQSPPWAAEPWWAATVVGGVFMASRWWQSSCKRRLKTETVRKPPQTSAAALWWRFSVAVSSGCGSSEGGVGGGRRCRVVDDRLRGSAAERVQKKRQRQCVTVQLRSHPFQGLQALRLVNPFYIHSFRMDLLHLWLLGVFGGSCRRLRWLPTAETASGRWTGTSSGDVGWLLRCAMLDANLESRSVWAQHKVGSSFGSVGQR